MNNFFYHNPVLLEKSICELITDPNGIYVDVTFGGGGHSNEVLCRLSKKGKLFAFDQDVDSKKNLINDRRFFFINSNFKHLKKMYTHENYLFWNPPFFKQFVSTLHPDIGLSI